MNTEALRRAIASLLGPGNPGDMAFTRALPSADIDLLLKDNQDSAGGWRLIAVGSSDAPGWVSIKRTLWPDCAASCAMPAPILPAPITATTVRVLSE